MATLTPAQLYAVNRAAGFDPAAAVIMTAIQLGESGGRSDAVGDVSLQDARWGPSIGISQVRSLRGELGTGGTRDATRLADPLFNARAAYAISGGGRNWSPWTVWNNRNDPGSGWTANLAKAQAAAAGGGGGGGLPPGLAGVATTGVDPLGLFGLPDPVAVVRKLSFEALFVALGLALLVAGAYRASAGLRGRVDAVQGRVREAVT